MSTDAESERVDPPRPALGPPRRQRRSSDAVAPSVAPAWMPLAAAAGALLVATGVGLLVAFALGGAAGRAAGGAVASLLVAATALALLVRVRFEGFLSLRALDVLWGFVLGAVLPFVAGVFAGSVGWPGYGALSPRWLVLGIAAPLVTALCLALFAGGLVFPAVMRATSDRLSAAMARVVAGALCAIAFVLVPIVFRDDVAAMPLALPIVLAIALGVFAAVTTRLWGLLVVATVFTGVWVALAVIGALLA